MSQQQQQQQQHCQAAINKRGGGRPPCRRQQSCWILTLIAWIVLDAVLIEYYLVLPISTSSSTSSSAGINAGDYNTSKEQQKRQLSLSKPGASASMKRPPLDSILDKNGRVIGDPGFLLDVAVIGFGKCGTSTVMDWIGMHPDVRAFPKEVWNLMDNQLPTFITRLYNELEPGPYLHGYKAPQDITQDHILNLYRKYWPNAKLILGIRHPVLWFQSFYNFRIQTVPSEKIDSFPAPEEFIGTPLCDPNKVKGSRRTCTSKGDFAFELMRLGKQNYNKLDHSSPTPLELEIVNKYLPTRHMDPAAVPYMENPVFLFDTNQLSDDEANSLQFRRDMTNFLGLQTVLGPIPHNKPGAQLEHHDADQRNKRKMDICDNQHQYLREHLMELARHTSRWIRESGFLDVPTVFVSQRERFEEQLRVDWMRDPCEAKKSTTTTA